LPDDRDEIERTGLFQDVIVRHFDREIAYNAVDYLRLLDTFSGDIAMKAWQRDGLYDHRGKGVSGDRARAGPHVPAAAERRLPEPQAQQLDTRGRGERRHANGADDRGVCRAYAESR
jgi:hypothetical protein